MLCKPYTGTIFSLLVAYMCLSCSISCVDTFNQISVFSLPDGLVALRHVLTTYYDLKNMKPELLQLLHGRTDESTEAAELSHLLEAGVRLTVEHQFWK